MDSVTDAKIKEVVNRDLADCTVVAVAHRIGTLQMVKWSMPGVRTDFRMPLATATIIDFDLILVLDDGHVAELGPPDILLQDPLSRFSRLATAQGLALPNALADPVADIEVLE